MKFLVDAQLPRKVCSWLSGFGHEAKHTLDLPLKNKTADHQIIEIAVEEDRIVVSKDNDFVQNFMVFGEPKLLMINTGNMSNEKLEKLLKSNLMAISEAFIGHRFIELTNELIVVHE